MVDAGDDSTYRYLGSGEALAFEVEGPTMESCLARAVEGFSSLCADVHPSVVPEVRAVTLTMQSPPALLRAVLEELLRLAICGELAVGVRDTRQTQEGLEVDLEAVPLSAARPPASVPPVLSWHDLALGEVEGRWVGRVVAATDRRDRSLN